MEIDSYIQNLVLKHGQAKADEFETELNVLSNAMLHYCVLFDEVADGETQRIEPEVNLNLDEKCIDGVIANLRVQTSVFAKAIAELELKIN